MRKKVRVAICNKYTLLREGLKAMFQEESPIEIVAEAGTASEAIEQARTLNPDVLLMDVATPDLPGAEATRRIKRANPRVEVLLLTMSEDDSLIGPCLQAGASGYVLRTTRPSQLLEAIDAVYRGSHPRGRKAA